MINIAICDDNKNVISRMKECLEEYKNDKCLIVTYECGEELLQEQKIFDIIFLDIDMQGLDGIETAKHIRKYDKNVKIIYVTNFTEYTNLAFEVHAFGYLSKPIVKEKIYSQLDEATQYFNNKKENNLIEFVTNEGIIRLAPSDIYYFEYVNRKVKIKTLNKTYITKQKISSIAVDMECFGFLVPHKSFTVNLFYIKAIKGYDLLMLDGSIVPLSQKRSVEFRETFNIFLENHIWK